MTYALDGELCVSTRTVAKTLLTKLASAVDTVLTDMRDTIIISKHEVGMVIVFNLRFDTEAQRDTIRGWLVARQDYAMRGALYQHTCKEDEGLPCEDYIEILKWGDWS